MSRSKVAAETWTYEPLKLTCQASSQQRTPYYEKLLEVESKLSRTELTEMKKTENLAKNRLRQSKSTSHHIL